MSDDAMSEGRPEAAPEHELRGGAMGEDTLRQAREEQEAIEKRLDEAMQRAGKALSQRLETDRELRRLAYMMLFSNRLFNWAIGEACALEGMTNEMANIFVKAQ